MAQNSGGKRTRGRPRKFVDLELVEKLAHIQCTYPEIASTLGVSVDTLTRHREFAATFKKGAEGGRKSLRRMQFESANKGNVVMQIWLGKQYLHQADRNLAEVRVIRSYDDLSEEEVDALLNCVASARLANEEQSKPASLPPAGPRSMERDGIIVDVVAEANSESPPNKAPGPVPTAEFS